MRTHLGKKLVKQQRETLYVASSYVCHFLMRQGLLHLAYSPRVAAVDEELHREISCVCQCSLNDPGVKTCEIYLQDAWRVSVLVNEARIDVIGKLSKSAVVD